MPSVFSTHDANLYDEVVVVRRLQARQHGHLRAALDLKQPDGIACPDHLEGRAVVGRYRRQRVIRVVVARDQIRAAMHHVQCAQAEQVHLEQPQFLDVVLIPLDDGSVRHAGVLYRHEPVDRLVAEQKAAGMNRQMARRIFDLAR